MKQLTKKQQSAIQRVAKYFAEEQRKTGMSTEQVIEAALTLAAESA